MDPFNLCSSLENTKFCGSAFAGCVVTSQDDPDTSQLVCMHARWCNNSDWSAPLLHPQLIWPCEGRLLAASCSHPSSYRPVSLSWPLVPMCHYIMLQFDSVTAAVQLQPCEHLIGFSSLSQTVTRDGIVRGGVPSLCLPLKVLCLSGETRMVWRNIRFVWVVENTWASLLHKAT